MNQTVPNSQAAARAAGFAFCPKDSAAFEKERYAHRWLVENVLVADQPAVIGGPKKSLKTSLAIDLAVSLGTGTPFLGHFRVPEPVRVAVLSGESGAATLQETARRVCASKRMKLADCDILWQSDLPRLSDPEDRDRLRDGLAAAAVRVAVIDPLYLCLLGGLVKAFASNLYEVGPLLRDAARACLDAGATPVLVHHATKGAGRKADGSEPPELDDLAFAGIGEFARQWLLVNRREPYRPGTGSHALNLAVGGSAGHSAHWLLDVREGMAGTDRGWRVELTAADQIPAAPPKRAAGAKPPGFASKCAD